MPEILEKLRPDRDLQCYFERPSAIAAMHHASASGFEVSGTWRQQFDWAVIEWNRDNVIEHPAFRNLPDGDLRGLTLQYDETRMNCIPLDSDLFPTVDWPYLRVWADDSAGEQFYQVPIGSYADPIEGSYVPATVEMELLGAPTGGDYVGFHFLGENHTYQLLTNDSLEDAAQALVDSVNTFSTQVLAEREGTRIRLTYVGEGGTPTDTTTGANGDRIGVYGFVSGAGTEQWKNWWAKFAGGQSPSKWRVTLPLDSLVAVDGRAVPVYAVRKMRWTYAAELQPDEYQRSEFRVVVSNWSVTGSDRTYAVAGPGSRRLESDSSEWSYSGTWTTAKGNFSGGTIHSTNETGAEAVCRYYAAEGHELYLGTRSAFNGTQVTVQVDMDAPVVENLLLSGEDVLRRMRLGGMMPGHHTVTVTHSGETGTFFYLDYLEVAMPHEELPSFPGNSKITLATDWDTDHSLAVAAERTAWMIHSLGFHGRVNHYVGALWHYELVRPGHEYAMGTIDFLGTPVFSEVTELRIGRVGYASEDDAVISHVNLIGDTAETIAKAFELELNRGYTAVHARADGGRLTIIARAMGTEGNLVTVSASPTSGDFYASVSGNTLEGGVDGEWRTDLAATPRLNRAVQDWSQAFYLALKNYGLEVVAAFSMELQHGDPSLESGIAQRYPSGEAALLNTPALQTNFSPTSTEFWKQVYADMANVMASVGIPPYLQFGEVQWWYFPYDGSGMPFYDQYTKETFATLYGREMAVIPSHEADPALYPEEVAFLPQLIGDFTDAVMSHVRASHPDCRFEVLYPTDVNETALNSLVNYPTEHWTPGILDNLKTESFTYTFTRDLDASYRTIEYGKDRGFSPQRRSFLVGIGDSKVPWTKEVNRALSENVESIVLFALDQYCLIGYSTPLPQSRRRSTFMG